MAQTTQWVRIETDPASTPRARHNHALVYDEEREVILMHGGRLQDDTMLSDTWQWDGQTWTQLATDGPKVFQHSMAYDPSRGVTVLYGGRTAHGHADPIGDTWEWDGQSWTLIEVGPTTPPPPVIGGMAYDPIRQRVVRQGGITAPDDTFDVGATWEWDGTQWKQANLPGPGRRGMHAMAYDTKRRRVVLFGGYRDCFRCEINETWEYGLAALRVTATERHSDGSLQLRWTGEAPPFQVQSRASLSAGDWQNEGQPSNTSSATVQTDGATKFFRVLSLYGNAP